MFYLQIKRKYFAPSEAPKKNSSTTKRSSWMTPADLNCKKVAPEWTIEIFKRNNQNTRAVNNGATCSGSIRLLISASRLLSPGGKTFTRIKDGFDRSVNSASHKLMCFWREIHLDAYCDQRQTGRRRRRPIWVRRWKGVCFIWPNSAEWEINRSVIKTSSVRPPFFLWTGWTKARNWWRVFIAAGTLTSVLDVAH